MVTFLWSEGLAWGALGTLFLVSPSDSRMEVIVCRLWFVGGSLPSTGKALQVWLSFLGAVVMGIAEKSAGTFQGVRTSMRMPGITEASEGGVPLTGKLKLSTTPTS